MHIVDNQYGIMHIVDYAYSSIKRKISFFKLPNNFWFIHYIPKIIGNFFLHWTVISGLNQNHPNSFFVTNLNFISLYLCNSMVWSFKLRSNRIHSLKYLRATTSGFKYTGIKKFWQNLFPLVEINMSVGSIYYQAPGPSIYLYRKGFKPSPPLWYI